MRIGYACLNYSVGCAANKTFRLKSYSQERLVAAVENNLVCLRKILEYNFLKKIFFFRISSDLVPFASHPICTYDWQRHFRKIFREIGEYIDKCNMRISMHPDQFILLNSPDEDVVNRSISELYYHAAVLDLMGLDSTAKIQLHVGGVYNDRKKSMERFAKRYEFLDNRIKKRLVIENDERNYAVSDCVWLSGSTGVPVLFDVFHHRLNSSGESLEEALLKVCGTWKRHDGVPMVDYSSQKKGAKPGGHARSIDLNDFKKFINQAKQFDVDIMLELKDKEKSALKAIEVLNKDSRLHKGMAGQA